MKIVSWFLGILILILSVAPCADSFASGSVNNQTQVSQLVKEHGKTILDDCSPFCVCNCCNTSAVTRHNPVTQIILVHSSIAYFELLPGAVRTAPISVWQPPKLG